jgi:hypothetical protein
LKHQNEVFDVDGVIAMTGCEVNPTGKQPYNRRRISVQLQQDAGSGRGAAAADGGWYRENRKWRMMRMEEDGGDDEILGRISIRRMMMRGIK